MNYYGLRVLSPGAVPADQAELPGPARPPRSGWPAEDPGEQGGDQLGHGQPGADLVRGGAEGACKSGGSLGVKHGGLSDEDRVDGGEHDEHHGDDQNHTVDPGEQRVSEPGLADHDVGALAAGEAAVQSQSADDHDVCDEEADGGEDGPAWA